MSRVLVVDDSWVVRHFMQSYLTVEGHEVIMAESGERALELVASSDPDLIFLDLLMPGLSGLGVLQELQTRTAAPPVVVLTADIQESTRADAMELGAAGFLSKPPDPDEVRRAAREHARTHE